jgi:CHRD domain
VHKWLWAIEARLVKSVEGRSMKTAIRISQYGALAAALLAVAATPAGAETLSFKADLAPVAGAESKASGTVEATYDTGSKKLTWQGRYEGIGTYATAANMYGPANNIVVRLRSIDSPFEGIAIVSEKQAPDLIAGRWFFVLSTAGAPNGELRGAIKPAN